MASVSIGEGSDGSAVVTDVCSVEASDEYWLEVAAMTFYDDGCCRVRSYVVGAAEGEEMVDDV